MPDLPLDSNRPALNLFFYSLPWIPNLRTLICSAFKGIFSQSELKKIPKFPSCLLDDIGYNNSLGKLCSNIRYPLYYRFSQSVSASQEEEGANGPKGDEEKEKGDVCDGCDLGYGESARISKIVGDAQARHWKITTFKIILGSF